MDLKDRLTIVKLILIIQILSLFPVQGNNNDLNGSFDSLKNTTKTCKLPNLVVVDKESTSVIISEPSHCEPDENGFIKIKQAKRNLMIQCNSSSPINFHLLYDSEVNDPIPAIKVLRLDTQFLLQLDFSFKQGGLSSGILSCTHVDNPCGHVDFKYNDISNKSSSLQISTSQSKIFPKDKTVGGQNKSCGVQFFVKIHPRQRLVEANCTIFNHTLGKFNFLGKLTILEESGAMWVEHLLTISMKQDDTTCLHVLTSEELCHNCTNKKEIKFIPIVLTCNYHGRFKVRQLIVLPIAEESHNVASLSRSEIYTSWTEVDFKKMISLQMRSEFVKGKSAEIRCTLSMFVFSTGSNTLWFNKVDEELEELESTTGSGYNLTHSFENIPDDLEIIYCQGYIWNSTEFISVSKSVTLVDLKPPKFKDNSENIEAKEGETNFELKCKVQDSGESPRYSWRYPDNDTSKWSKINVTEDSSFLVFPIANPKIEGTYRCTACNSKDCDIKLFNVKILKGTLWIWGVVIGGIILLLICLVALNVYFVKKNRKQSKTLDLYVTKSDIKTFLHGDQKRKMSNVSVESYDGKWHEIQESPYNHKYELSSQYWEIERHNKLGEGKFGVVVRGKVHSGSDELEVAVKMPKSNGGQIGVKTILQELKFLADIEPHPNIVRIIAADSKRIKRNKIFIGMEYCVHGSLRKYLRNNRDAFATLQLDEKSKYYVPTSSVQSSSEPNVETDVDKPNLQLLKWSYQIACGLSYLHKHRIVHGDVAARNVLVAADFTIRLSDLGMAAQIPNDEEVVTLFYPKEHPVPWRWMAPETIFKDKDRVSITLSSDVWSLGVTLWEVWTLGQSPYTTQTFGEEFRTMIENGYRLPKPERASRSVYKVMIQCWNIVPNDRPGTKYVMEAITKVITLSYKDEYETLGS